MENERPSLAILVAEDNAVVNDILCGMLKRMGFKPDTVENGADALAAVKAKNYDLLFLDLKMPVMNGVETTLRIQREVAPAQRPLIIAHSNYGNDFQTGVKAGIHGFLSKPCDYDRLVRFMGVFVPALRDAEFYPPAAPQNQHTDLTSLYEITGGNPDFLTDVLRMILDRLPGDMERIATSLENGDYEGLRKAAHKVKSSAGYAGARGLLALLTELEMKAAEGEAALSELYADALSVSQSVFAELERELNAQKQVSE